MTVAFLTLYRLSEASGSLVLALTAGGSIEMSASGNLACIEREEVLTCLVKSSLEASILTEGALTEIAASGS